MGVDKHDVYSFDNDKRYNNQLRGFLPVLLRLRGQLVHEVSCDDAGGPLFQVDRKKNWVSL
jgi:hypothetical protein